MATPVLLTLALGWQGTNSDQLVTYEARGMSAPRVVRELGEKFGLKLACSPAFVDEPLIVRVNNVRLSVLREKIADVLNGNWSYDSDRTLRLVPRPNEKPSQRIRRIAQEIRKQQQEVRRQLETQKPFDTRTAKQMADDLKLLAQRWNPDASEDELAAMERAAGEIAARSPYEQFCKRLFVELPPEEMAQVDWMHRQVWTATPTRRQLMLPQRAHAAFRTLYSDIGIWENSGSIPANTDFWILDTRLYDLVNRYDPSEEDPRRPAPLRDMQVLVEASGNGDGDNAYIVRFFGPGLVTRVVTFVPTQWIPVQESQPKRLQLRNGDAKIVLSDLAMEIVKRSSSATMHTTTYERPDSKVEKFLLQPEKNDPCSLLLPDLFLALGDGMGRNVVIVPNDNVFFFYRRIADGRTTMSALEPLLSASHNIEYSTDGSWLTGTPKVQINRGAGTRVSRSGLGVLLRRIQKEDRLTIDAAAEYAYRHLGVRNWAFSRIQQFLVLYRGDQRSVSTEDLNGMWLWLFGSFDAYQLRELFSGKSLSLPSLRPEQVDAIRKYVYAWPGYLISNDQELERYSLSGIPLVDEPTIRWPVDLPAYGHVAVDVQSESVALAFGTISGQPYSEPLSASSLASRLETKPAVDEGDDRFEISHFKMLQRRTITLRVQLDSQFYIKGILTERTSPTGRDLTLNELPQAFLDEVEKHRHSIRSNPPPVGSSLRFTARTSRSLRSPSP